MSQCKRFDFPIGFELIIKKLMQLSGPVWPRKYPCLKKVKKDSTTKCVWFRLNLYKNILFYDQLVEITPQMV